MYYRQNRQKNFLSVYSLVKTLVLSHKVRCINFVLQKNLQIFFSQQFVPVLKYHMNTFVFDFSDA